MTELRAPITAGELDEGARVRRGLLVFRAVAFGAAWTLWGLLRVGGELARPEAGAFLVASRYAPALGVIAVW